MAVSGSTSKILASELGNEAALGTFAYTSSYREEWGVKMLLTSEPLLRTPSDQQQIVSTTSLNKMQQLFSPKSDKNI